MNIRAEFQSLQQHAHQLNGIITALNCCIDDRERNNICAELVAEADKLSSIILDEIDHVDPFIRKLGA